MQPRSIRLFSKRITAFYGFHRRLFLSVLFTALCAGISSRDADARASDSFQGHSVQLSWSGTDLRRIEKLAIDTDAAVEILPGRPGHPLRIWMDLQVQNHDFTGWVRRWRDSLMAESVDLRGVAPAVRAHSLHCEIKSDRGRIVHLNGACVRKLRVTVPADAPLSLRLAGWNGTAIAGEARQSTPLLLRKLEAELGRGRALRVENASADIHLEGGGEDAIFMVNGLKPASGAYSDLNQGEVIARLSEALSLVFNCVQGKIILHLDQQDPTWQRASVDGRPIEEFPFHRPRQPGLCTSRI